MSDKGKIFEIQFYDEDYYPCYGYIVCKEDDKYDDDDLFLKHPRELSKEELIKLDKDGILKDWDIDLNNI